MLLFFLRIRTVSCSSSLVTSYKSTKTTCSKAKCANSWYVAQQPYAGNMPFVTPTAIKTCIHLEILPGQIICSYFRLRMPIVRPRVMTFKHFVIILCQDFIKTCFITFALLAGTQITSRLSRYNAWVLSRVASKFGGRTPYAFLNMIWALIVLDQVPWFNHLHFWWWSFPFSKELSLITNWWHCIVRNVK